MSIHSSGNERQSQSFFNKTPNIQSDRSNVIDFDRSNRRADEYYQQAMTLRYQQSLPDLQQDPLTLASIHDALMLSTELGSAKAPMALAEQCLAGLFCHDCHHGNALRFLTLSADRKQPEAAYYLGASYAGTGELPQIEAILKANPALHVKERERLALHYLTIGAEQQHAASLETLVLGYAYGWPFLPKEPSRLLLLGKKCVEQDNSSITLALGAWLIGYTVNGDPIPDDIKPLSVNVALGLSYLLRVSQHHNLHLATSALQVISSAIANDDLPVRWVSTIVANALGGNALLALYLAWYSLPEAERPELPALIQINECPGFAKVFLPSYEKATFYFDVASKSSDPDISKTIKSFCRPVFSGYVNMLNDLKVVAD